jgi:thiamine-monophosphate kinase
VGDHLGVESEFDLIARLRSVVEGRATGDGPAEVAVGSGDDAAVTVPAGATATSVDMLIEGVHFRRETAPLRSVGWKALAASLSDLAAMGAEAGEAYVQLGIPEDLDADGATELADGMAAAAGECGARILGGDVSRAPVLTIGMTVVGHAPGAGELVTRAGAQPGDLLVVTGELGGAAAGLLLLDRPELEAAVGKARAEALRRRQLEPTPRLGAGRALAASGARAMIDLSDGLAGDAEHLAGASEVRILVDLNELPVAEGVQEVAAAAGIDPLELAAAGGEDYELLAAVAPESLDRVTRAVAEQGAALRPIGRIEAGTGLALTDAGGERNLAGFDQLRSRPGPS